MNHQDCDDTTSVAFKNLYPIIFFLYFFPFLLEVIRWNIVEHFILNWLGGHKLIDRYIDTQLLLFVIYTFTCRQEAILENWRRKRDCCSLSFYHQTNRELSPLVMYFPVLYLIPPGFHLTYGIENKVITSPILGKIVSFHFFCSFISTLRICFWSRARVLFPMFVWESEPNSPWMAQLAIYKHAEVCEASEEMKLLYFLKNDKTQYLPSWL